MRKDFEKLFKSLPHLEPPARLYGNILSKIEKTEKRTSIIRFVLLGLITLISGGLMIPVFQYVGQAFQQSGFYQYLSLLFSDADAVFSSFTEFSFSLIESFPMLETTILLVIALIFLESLKLTINSITPFAAGEHRPGRAEGAQAI